MTERSPTKAASNVEDERLAKATRTIRIGRCRGTDLAAAEDQVAIEEPLEFRVAEVKEGLTLSQGIAITMRTPGADEELALGFLYTEGVISNRDCVAAIGHPRDQDGEPACNVITVTLAEGVAFDAARLTRHVFTSSSCGICGKMTIDQVRQSCLTPPAVGATFEANLFPTLPAKLRQGQEVFRTTGGLHAAALFDREGNLLRVREDVGRHNAVDKLIGSMLRAGTLHHPGHLLLVSGRASFELVQKAILAGIPAMAAIGAPSSLAAELAREFGMLLIGFLHGEGFNVYSGEEKLILTGAKP